MFSMAPHGSLIVHIGYVTIGVMAVLIICSLPEQESQVAQPNSLRSTLSMMGVRSSILGFVVPIGKLRYVKGNVLTEHPKVWARWFIFSAEVLIGNICDFL